MGVKGLVVEVARRLFVPRAWRVYLCEGILCVNINCWLRFSECRLGDPASQHKKALEDTKASISIFRIY